MVEVKIRPFELADMEEVLDIEVSNFPKDPYSKAHFLMWHTELPEGFLVAELDNKIIGYVMVSKEDSTGQLISIAILPSYGRRGIGSKLLKEGIKILSKLGAKKIVAETRASNKIALKFFAKHNFEEVEKIKKYYGDGEDAVKLEKKL